MPTVQFTRHLQARFPDAAAVEVPTGTLAEIVRHLDGLYPGMAGYLLEDQGSLRQHVNIFINEELLKDRARLSDAVGDRDRVFVMQALSGG